MPESGDQLKQALAEISTDETEIARLKDAVAEAEKKWTAATSELNALKAAATNTPAEAPAPAPASDAVKAVAEERDKLKEELAARSKDLADAEAHHSEELLSIRSALQHAEQQRDDFEKQLNAANTAQPAPASAPASVAPEKMEQLQARIAVLEASPVPYTPDELAILKLSPPRQAPEPPKAAPLPRHAHSINDLPQGAGPVWKEALNATMEHNYDLAEQKFNEVLRQDPNNVYVLAYLANAQFAAGHL